MTLKCSHIDAVLPCKRGQGILPGASEGRRASLRGWGACSGAAVLVPRG